MKKILLTFCLSIVFTASGQQVPNKLQLKTGQRIFASGMNLAWVDFGRDLIDFEEAEFIRAFDEVSSAGGNTIRWWIHVNGSTSPRFDDGKVCGLNAQEIPTLQRALDLAQARNIVLLLTLWSFDMLQEQAGVDLTRNKRIIEAPEYTRAYIQNALIPLVQALKDHSAMLAWEICNEPEGMSQQWGWCPVRTTMTHIQRFHNLLAGAIHRVAPRALVCNGAWNIQSMANVGSFQNYYADQALIHAGGDSLGTLDFYQVHYYPRWYNEDYSPFHHPAAYWQLDKPILIGEFQAKGLVDLGHGYRPKTTLTTEEAYLFAIQNGYAGCLSWTWTGHDGFGGLPEAALGMKLLKQKFPTDITIRFD